MIFKTRTPSSFRSSLSSLCFNYHSETGPGPGPGAEATGNGGTRSGVRRPVARSRAGGRRRRRRRRLAPCLPSGVTERRRDRGSARRPPSDLLAPRSVICWASGRRTQQSGVPALADRLVAAVGISRRLVLQSIESRLVICGRDSCGSIAPGEKMHDDVFSKDCARCRGLCTDLRWLGFLARRGRSLSGPGETMIRL